MITLNTKVIIVLLQCQELEGKDICAQIQGVKVKSSAKEILEYNTDS